MSTDPKVRLPGILAWAFASGSTVVAIASGAVAGYVARPARVELITAVGWVGLAAAVSWLVGVWRRGESSTAADLWVGAGSIAYLLSLDRIGLFVSAGGPGRSVPVAAVGALMLLSLSATYFARTGRWWGFGIVYWLAFFGSLLTARNVFGFSAGSLTHRV